MKYVNGIQIASSIVRGDLVDLCPEIRVKCKIVKKSAVKKPKLSQESVNLAQEREYILFKPFNNDLELAKLYFKESPNCTEIFSLLDSNNLIVKSKAISMLLFILHHFSPINNYSNYHPGDHLANNFGDNFENNLGNNLSNFSPGVENLKPSDGPETSEKLSKKKKLIEKVLKLFKEKIDEIFLNDDVIINYSLKLLLECVKSADLDALTEFLMNFNFFNYLTKCHIFSPDKDNFINSFFSNYFTTGGSTTNESTTSGRVVTWDKCDRDVYHENGKLKLCIILLLGVKGVNILRKDLIYIIKSHLKLEKLSTQLSMSRVLVNILNQSSKIEIDDHIDKLINDINNIIITLYKHGNSNNSGELDNDLDDEMFYGLLRDLLKFTHKTSLCTKLILKYDLKLFKVISNSLYKLNEESYKSYVNAMKCSSTDVSLFLDIVEEFYDFTHQVPGCMTKIIINKLFNNLKIINKLIKILIKINSLPDFNLLLKLINNYHTQTHENSTNFGIISSVDDNSDNSTNSVGNGVDVDLSGLLELLSRFDGVKSIFDPLRLLKYSSISANYDYINQFFSSCGTDTVNSTTTLTIEKMELDKSLMKCIYNLSIKDNIILGKLHYKCFSILLQRYTQTLHHSGNWTGDYNSQLFSYVKAILNNLIQSDLTEIYIVNLDTNMTNLFIILYNLLVTHNLQLIYPSPTSDVVSSVFSCFKCVLGCYFKGDLYLLMLLTLLIQLRSKLQGTRVTCSKCNLTVTNLVKSISDNKSHEKPNDWENTLEKYILKVLANVLSIPSHTTTQVSTLLAHYNIPIQPIPYNYNTVNNIVGSDVVDSVESVNPTDSVDTVENSEIVENLEWNVLRGQMLNSLINDSLDKNSLVKCAKQFNNNSTNYYIQTLVYTHEISL